MNLYLVFGIWYLVFGIWYLNPHTRYKILNTSYPLRQQMQIERKQDKNHDTCYQPIVKKRPDASGNEFNERIKTLIHYPKNLFECFHGNID